jgi:hypothetical protein
MRPGRLEQAGDQRTTTLNRMTVYVEGGIGQRPDDTKVKAVFSTVDVEGDGTTSSSTTTS